MTDLELQDDMVEKIGQGGRARWRIENETFNTLKNQGYQFEHNFGHGKKHLSTVMAYLMFIAFLIDQTQELTCKLFKDSLARGTGRTHLWDKIRSLFFSVCVNGWEQVYQTILGLIHWVPAIDSS